MPLKRRRRPEGDVGLHLRCLRHRSSLDRLIGGGADVGSEPELALRARELVADRRRDHLAAALRTVLAEAEHPGGGRSSVVPVARDPVVAAQPAGSSRRVGPRSRSVRDALSAS